MMHKKLFVLVVCLFIVFSLKSQVQIIDSLPNHFYGSAGKLKGKTLVINAFVYSENVWKQIDKTKKLQNEADVFAWIKKQAYLLDVRGITFDTISLNCSHDIVIDKIFKYNKYNKPEATLNTIVLNAVGITNIRKYYDSLKAVSHADNIILLVFYNASGRSYAQPSAYEKWDERFLETAVIYNLDDRNYDAKSGVIAHQILHLFGARDMNKYKKQNVVKHVNLKAFENSVMYNCNQSLDFLKMDQLTMWCIGWTNTWFKWYDMFKKEENDLDEMPL